MEAGRQQDGLSHEKRIVQRSRSRRLRSTGKATERQAAGKFGIPRLVEFKLLPSDSLKYRVRKSQYVVKFIISNYTQFELFLIIPMSLI